MTGKAKMLDGIDRVAVAWVGPDGIEWWVEVTWAEVGGVLTPVGISFTNTVDAPITREVLRVPLAKVLTDHLDMSQVHRRFLARYAAEPVVRKWASSPTPPAQKRPRGRPPLSDEFLQHVADLWRAGPERGAPKRVHAALLDELGPKDAPAESTVLHYISEARKREFLPPKKNKKKEHPE